MSNNEKVFNKFKSKLFSKESKISCFCPYLQETALSNFLNAEQKQNSFFQKKQTLSKFSSVKLFRLPIQIHETKLKHK